MLLVSILIPSIILLMPAIARAQEESVPRLEFRPHCEEETACNTFDIRDPLSVQTSPFKAGDTIDIDLMLQNPGVVPVSRFRVWIAYDPLIFEGKEATLSDHFPTPTPGETGFESDEGFLKLSGTALTPVSASGIVLARITMSLRATQNVGSPLTFFDDPETPEPETGVFSTEGGAERNILTSAPGYLYVQLTPANELDAISSSSAASSNHSDTSIASSLSSDAFDVSSSPASAESSSLPSASEPSTVFAMLQVQGLRVTTEGSTAYLAWDALPSPELIGYHLYYGTVSGQYIQRHAIDKGEQSVAIRSLPIDTTYYFAIRGVNAQEQETDFSREVGISIGNPRTSTAPFVANSLPTPTPDTNGTLAGDTGIPSNLVLFLVLSALIGTFIAFRRQLNLGHSSMQP